ncbi:hypothetical protein B0H13DRAFT_620457 [Mycena leptocephala]|nr:hypothetical protein B0H13DRAFT_620457 [Mycena leptocephala]
MGGDALQEVRNRPHMDLRFEIILHGGSNAIWFSQANYTFSQLNITSDYDRYIFVNNLSVSIILQGPFEAIAFPTAFLFVCGPTHLLSSDKTRFQHPSCSAYWSLDPSGVQRLTPQEASDLGLPLIHTSISVNGTAGDARVYTALRQFHHKKGFNPESQDIAKDLGLPLLYVVAEDSEIDISPIYLDWNFYGASMELDTSTGDGTRFSESGSFESKLSNS